MAAALNAPVAVMETAGEGGAWGIALLAGYMADKAEGETLEAYLANRIFAGKLGETVRPDKADVESFDAYIERYSAGLPIEKAAVECVKM
jgi:sugar (pentulose or hexulose) kinase